MKLYLVACIVFTVISSSMQCEVPSPKQPIDWSKIPETWFLAFTSGDAVMGEMDCNVIHNLKKTDAGFALDGYFYSNGVLKDKEHIVKKILPNGNYVSHLSHGKYEDIARGNMHKALVAEVQTINSEKDQTLHSTDSKTYLYHISCSATGEYIVWCYTSNPNPDLMTLYNAFKDLISYGITPKNFQPSKCNQINFAEK
uniref:uncharacterized protein LOC120345592 n=1 Tax=Styela clava TaxID=7725 RepID=UPI001939B35E|nr:uncharacterized protein LOC120345592 [Styela clava]